MPVWRAKLGTAYAVGDSINITADTAINATNCMSFMVFELFIATSPYYRGTDIENEVLHGTGHTQVIK